MFPGDDISALLPDHIKSLADDLKKLPEGYHKWLYGAPGHTMYNHIRPPNDRSGPDCRGGIPHSNKTDAQWILLSHNVTAHSQHVGGVYTLFCDGHVKFVSNSVDLATWQGMGSRYGGEILGDF